MAANAAAADRSRGSQAKLSIGQVLQRIGAEFPDVTPSKLRFLEDQGLIKPARSASGYRKYSDDDVDRVRTILSMQRDHYLPLRVIGRYLEELDEGLEPAMPGAQTTPASILRPGAELDRRGLVARAHASTALVEQAVSAGLIAAAGPYYDEDLAMLRTLVELERVGIEPRHLRAFRTAAQHELGLIEQALGASRRRDQAAQARRVEIAELLGEVRRSLVRGALRDEPGAARP